MAILNFGIPFRKKVLVTVKDLNGLQKALSKVSKEAILYHANRSEYSKWLRSRALFPLADLFSKVEYDDFDDTEKIRTFLINAIKAYRVYRSRGIISKFNKNKYDEYLGVCKNRRRSLGW